MTFCTQAEKNLMRYFEVSKLVTNIYLVKSPHDICTGGTPGEDSERAWNNNVQEVRLVLKFLIQPSLPVADTDTPTLLPGIFWCLRQPLPFIIYYYQHLPLYGDRLGQDLIRVLYFFSSYLLSSISSARWSTSVLILSDTGIYLTWPQYFRTWNTKNKSTN